MYISPYFLYILYWPVVLPGCWPIDPLVLFLPADRRDPIWSQFAQRLERSKARQHWSVLLIYWSWSLHEKAADQNDNFVDDDAIILQNQNIVLDHKDVSKSQSYAIEKGFEYLDGFFLPLSLITTDELHCCWPMRLRTHLVSRCQWAGMEQEMAVGQIFNQSGRQSKWGRQKLVYICEDERVSELLSGSQTHNECSSITCRHCQ